MKIIVAFFFVSVGIISCHRDSHKTLTNFSFDTSYKNVSFKIESPISSNFNFHYSDYNSDIEGYQKIKFIYSDTDTGVINICQSFSNQLYCNQEDNVVFRKHVHLIEEFDNYASQFHQFVDTIDNIRCLITQYNNGCYVSICLEGESQARIELTNVKDSIITKNFLSSLKVI